MKRLFIHSILAAAAGMPSASAFAATNWTEKVQFNAPSNQGNCVRVYNVRRDKSSTATYTKQVGTKGVNRFDFYAQPVSGSLYHYTLWANSGCSGTARRSGWIGVSSNGQFFQFNY